MQIDFKQSRKAAKEINLLTDDAINKILLAVADQAQAQAEYIVCENAKDLALMDPKDPKYDRLMLTVPRIADIASDMRNVASLPSPLGIVLSNTLRPNGMKIEKVTVPFGVIGIIYEARPNVSFDVFSLCLKSGNACVLKGGSDAHNSNMAIVSILKTVLEQFGVTPYAVQLLPPDRQAAALLMEAVGDVDLIIPRGSQSLITFVRDHSKVPVIETGAGICHVYFDQSGDVEKGAAIVVNAKTRRVSVCNALDCLIMHQDRLLDLPVICEQMAEKGVLIYADPKAYDVLKASYPQELLIPATEESFGTEFQSLKMAVKTVLNLDEALSHIEKHSSKHSETIVTESDTAWFRFSKEVDAACVYKNVSTAFTDGSQFGFGAEIGISTQKLHARGPMALPELTSYKYIIEGDGQIRS